MAENTILVPILGDCIPIYATEGSSGADVYALVDPEPYIEIEPGTCRLISTGIKVAIPPGFEIQVRSRSGLAFNNQIVVLNSPGTIDSDYRGEIGVILMNHGNKAFRVFPGMKIAQLVLAPVSKALFVPRDSLECSPTKRGTGGFGSTGL